eukprot:2109403-Rhodomonas_salina.1
MIHYECRSLLARYGNCDFYPGSNSKVGFTFPIMLPVKRVICSEVQMTSRLGSGIEISVFGVGSYNHIDFRPENVTLLAH